MSRELTQFRSVAIIPAAGRSVRMGTAKLLLPWRDSTVMEAVLAAWRASRVGEMLVVVHPEDTALAERCARAGATVVPCDPPPPDMKASLQCGLRHAARTFTLNARDCWLTAPADLPALRPEAINWLLTQWRPDRPEIIVAQYGERMSHPLLIPWEMARELDDLAPDEGLHVLLKRHGARPVRLPPGWYAADMDTPEDYARLREQCGLGTESGA